MGVRVRLSPRLLMKNAMLIGLTIGVFVGNMLPCLFGMRTLKEGLCIASLAAVLTFIMFAIYLEFTNEPN